MRGCSVTDGGIVAAGTCSRDGNDRQHGRGRSAVGAGKPDHLRSRTAPLKLSMNFERISVDIMLFSDIFRYKGSHFPEY